MLTEEVGAGSVLDKLKLAGEVSHGLEVAVNFRGVGYPEEEEYTDE